MTLVDFLESPQCPKCGGETVWLECTGCGGSGEIPTDVYNEITYGENYTDCEKCAGEGGAWFCERCNV